MTKNIIPALLVFFTLFGCNQKNNLENEKNILLSKKDARIELTPFMINEIVLHDSGEIKTAGYGEVIDGKWYPTEIKVNYKNQYNQMSADQMKLLLQTLIHSPEPKVYLDIDTNELSRNEIFMFANCCDSIIEMDDSRYLFCDSASMYNGIQKIIFYETWYIKPENGGIEKEVLGYTLCQKLEGTENEQGKDKFKFVLHVFNTREALQKAKNYFIIKHNKAGK